MKMSGKITWYGQIVTVQMEEGWTQPGALDTKPLPVVTVFQR